MLIVQCICSAILIICGILVWVNPNFIAGYNTLSPTEKSKIDSRRLALFMRNCLIAIGLFTLMNYVVLNIIGLRANTILIINTCLILVGIGITSIYANTVLRKPKG